MAGVGQSSDRLANAVGRWLHRSKHSPIADLGGLDLWIGEDGVRLSGGERRRLALARALMSHAAILVLDEPTEGLPLATETMIVERLSARLERTGQGLLLICHHEGPQRLCDGVVLLPSARGYADIAA